MNNTIDSQGSKTHLIRSADWEFSASAVPVTSTPTILVAAAGVAYAAYAYCGSW